MRLGPGRRTRSIRPAQPSTRLRRFCRPRRWRLLPLCAAWIGLAVAAVWAQNPPPDLTAVSLEDLMSIEVTSASKKEEKLFQTAAAIYVITQEEIRRSGLTSIPELLRLAPGLEVARIDGSKWAISSRGFNGRFANKLLILIDGRSIYSPESGGVYWESQNLPVEEIERIEVIRGPGGTLWGANAVNGIINIITKHTIDTLGGLATAGGGSEDRGFGSVHYGSLIGQHASYRVYARYFNRQGLATASGLDARDEQRATQGGFRLDWQASERDALTVHGDLYDSRLQETSSALSLAAPFAPPAPSPSGLSGGNVLARWNRVFSESSDLAFQFYFDRSRRETRDAGVRIDTFDLDLQYRFALGRRQNLTSGLSYRLIADQTNSNSGTPVQFNPKAQRVQIFSALVQDELTLIKDRLRLTLGTKVEHNDYTGFEAQPSARLLWTPSGNQTIWAAVSRAIRTPARVYQGLRINTVAMPNPGGLPTIIAIFGDRSTSSEEFRAYELGYRVQPGRRLSLDLATFYNFYDRLTAFERGTPFLEAEPQPHLLVPFVFNNALRGENYGLEASANLELSNRWKVRAGYSFLKSHLRSKQPDPFDLAARFGGASPQHQFQFHSYFRLPRGFELDGSLYRNSRLPAPQIPGYTRLDLRLGWRVRENLRLNLGLQNLLDDRHPEFNNYDVLVVPSQVKRSIYGKVAWRF